jgi:hypothetical protein
MRAPRLPRFQRLDLTSDLASTDLTPCCSASECCPQLTDCEAAFAAALHQQSHCCTDAATGALVGGGPAGDPGRQQHCRLVFTHGQPLLSDDVMSVQRFFREIDALTRFETRSILGVPLKTKNKVMGVIESVNKVQGRFDEEDVQILQTLAAQAAIAIENSQLFKQSDLIAEIVHELRTPLASITAAAHLLQRPGCWPSATAASPTPRSASSSERPGHRPPRALRLNGRVHIPRSRCTCGFKGAWSVRPQAQAGNPNSRLRWIPASPGARRSAAAEAAVVEPAD